MDCKDDNENGNDDNEKPPQTSTPSLRGQCSPPWTCEQSRYKRSFDRDDKHYQSAFKQLDCGHDMMSLVIV